LDALPATASSAPSGAGMTSYLDTIGRGATVAVPPPAVPSVPVTPATPVAVAPAPTATPPFTNTAPSTGDYLSTLSF